MQLVTHKVVQCNYAKYIHLHSVCKKITNACDHNHWAASVAQWLEHLSSKQCVVGSNPTRAALFSFRRKKSCLG